VRHRLETLQYCYSTVYDVLCSADPTVENQKLSGVLQWRASGHSGGAVGGDFQGLAPSERVKPHPNAPEWYTTVKKS